VILVGELSVWIALLMSAWATTVSFAGGAMQRSDLSASGRRAIYVAAGTLLLANAGVIGALLSRDFSFAYVARHTSLDLSAPYVVSALWSGTAGSLLVGALAVAALGGTAVMASQRRARSASPWIAGVVGLLLLALTLVLCFARSPYARLGWLAADGLGLDPMLRHAEMVLARPAVLIGLAAIAVAAAVAVGAYRARLPGSAWARCARPWLLPGWTLLSLGGALQMRGWYAYTPAGGVWRWTPLTITMLGVWAFSGVVLHARAIRGARRRHGRVGEHLSHAGAVVALAGVVGGAWGNAHPLHLRTGEEARATDPMGHHWTFVSQGVSRYGTADHDVTAVTLESWRDDVSRGLVVSQRLGRRTAPGGAPPVSQPALRTAGLVDVRVAVDSTTGDLADVRLTFVPLAGLIWWGAALLVLGGFTAMLPVRSPHHDASVEGA
jgi:cytochrome c biogenesis factor